MATPVYCMPCVRQQGMATPVYFIRCVRQQGMATPVYIFNLILHITHQSVLAHY